MIDATTSTDTGAPVQPPKRKRGRPPKHPAAAAVAAEAAAVAKQHAAPKAAQQASPNEDGAQPAKRRGRPPGSRNRLSKNYGNSMVPQVIMVASGEDVYEKLRDLSCSYRRSLVVLAASGLLSAATLMQLKEGGQGTAVTLTGSFTVLSISGALLQPAEPNTSSSSSSSAIRDHCTQFLSASLANPSGGVVGGMVAGPLVAAGPVMVIIGHWEPDKQQQAGTANGDAAAAGGAAPTPTAAAADADSAGDDDDVAVGGDALLQQLGDVNLAAAVAAAAAAAAASADGGEGLLGLPIEQLQRLLSAAAAAERGANEADEDVSGGGQQAGAGWCGGLGLCGEAGSGGQHGDEEEQQQHEQDEADGDD